MTLSFLRESINVSQPRYPDLFGWTARAPRGHIARQLNLRVECMSQLRMSLPFKDDAAAVVGTASALLATVVLNAGILHLSMDVNNQLEMHVAGGGSRQS